jgi:ATP-binding cassette subfamily B protein
MKNGTVIEQGTHEELIRQKGFYEELYNSQFTTRPEIQEDKNE